AEKFRSLRKDEDGVTAMEYGLIAALVAVVIIGAVTAVGNSLSGVFQAINTALAAAL
ncbi:MAG: Flp family type IVb pilin, partial [Acetobacteraceae bacterium]|nr:Flp family type IVb pilin [Acetobacteraceae bacterium]